METSEIIKNFVENFVQKELKERSLNELLKPKKREKFTRKINNWFSILDPKKLQPTPEKIHNPEMLIDLLPIKSDQDCYLITDIGEFDGKIISFRKALLEVCDGSCGVIVYAFKINKLYYSGEMEIGTPDRLISK